MENRDDWKLMSYYVQEFNYFSRNILSHQKDMTLTLNEIEILSYIYFTNCEVTPLTLSKRMGMKKESLSRILKSLFQKSYIEKSICSTDERSYYILITVEGEKELDKNYHLMLAPLYDLKEFLGSDFSELISLITGANYLFKQRKP